MTKQREDDFGPGDLPRPELTCYRVHEDAAEIVPARSERAWMDGTYQRSAYRCIPLSMANASGWEMLVPSSFQATYFGGDAIEDMQLRSMDGDEQFRRHASSHFGYGVLTFHSGWLFRTPPGWAIWARGAPNAHRDKIVPLEGIVETDWLPFPFTMNWRFTRPGTVQFNKGEAFCFLTLMPHGVLDQVQPRVMALEDDPTLKAAHDTWLEKRLDFNVRLKNLEPEAVAQGWQKHYARGDTSLGGSPPTFHITKRRLKKPD